MRPVPTTPVREEPPSFSPFWHDSFAGVPFCCSRDFILRSGRTIRLRVRRLRAARCLNRCVELLSTPAARYARRVASRKRPDGGSRERSEREPRSDATAGSVRTAFDASDSERRARRARPKGAPGRRFELTRSRSLPAVAHLPLAAQIAARSFADADRSLSLAVWRRQKRPDGVRRERERASGSSGRDRRERPDGDLNAPRRSGSLTPFASRAATRLLKSRRAVSGELAPRCRSSRRSPENVRTAI